MPLRDKTAELQLYWRILQDVRLGAMSIEEAVDELTTMHRNTENPNLRERIAGEICELYARRNLEMWAKHPGVDFAFIPPRETQVIIVEAKRYKAVE